MESSTDLLFELLSGYAIGFVVLILAVFGWAILRPNLLASRALNRIKGRVRGEVHTKAYLFLPSLVGQHRGKSLKVYFRYPLISYFIPVYFSHPMNFFVEYGIRAPFYFSSAGTPKRTPSTAGFLDCEGVSEKVDYLLKSFDEVTLEQAKAVLMKKRVFPAGIDNIMPDDFTQYLGVIDFLVEKGHDFKNSQR